VEAVNSLLRGLVVLSLVAGCGSSDVDFSAKYAPDLRREGTAVSVLGVYRDGRMDAESWNDLGPRFAPALGAASCSVAFDEALLANDRPLADAVTDRAMQDGPTDELLDVFAPAAESDTILLLTVAGHPPSPMPTAKQQAQGSSPPPSAIGGGRRGMGRAAYPQGRSAPRPSKDAFEVAASLYSVREHKTVGILAMTYTGTSTDAALASFVERLRSELPHMQCRGWKHDVKIDAERVRNLAP
jgi:hypothetical protein